MASRRNKALLYWHTARHLKLSQLYWRIRYRASSRRTPHYGSPQPLPPTNDLARDGLRDLASHWAKSAPPDFAMADAFLKGRFSFQNKTVKSTQPLWTGLDVPKLWLYHLHYFDYARDIALLYPDSDSPAAAHVHGWLTDWVAKNTDFKTIGWDSFPLSTRLLNWSLILAIYSWDDFTLRESMHVQLDALRQNLERDLRGNHLLKNVAALAVAGTLLNSAHGNLGWRLLKKEVGLQFLADGGHVERSPMYHTQALLDLVLATAVSDPIPDWLSGAIERGLAFLHGVTHGDGRYAQFNDGAVDEGLSPATVQRVAKKFYWNIGAPPGSMDFPQSGLYRLAPGRDAGLLLAKAGDTTLNHQPGHAHSDLLSFEFSLAKRRMLINAGTHGYAASPYRDYCRCTAAQNTVRINGHEQLEHWSTFRVARRIHGTVEFWDPHIPALRASYQTLHGPRHAREFSWDARGWWRIVDTFSGQGELVVESFLHTHPDCATKPLETPESTGRCTGHRIVSGPETLNLWITGADSVTTVCGEEDPCQGWYFPRFGEAIPATTFVVRAKGNGTLQLVYLLAPGDKRPSMSEIVGALHTAGASG